MNSGIRDKLSELVVNYKRLTEYYRRITEFGDEEVLLIDQGDMESLLGILREKEEIMIEVSRCQEQVGEIQDCIANNYQLESFSVNELIQVVDSSNRDLVERLKQEIKRLIKHLEILEQQERIHESMLRNYAKQVSQIQSPPMNSTGKKAYEKMLKTKDKANDIDLKR